MAGHELVNAVKTKGASVIISPFIILLVIALILAVLSMVWHGYLLQVAVILAIIEVGFVPK